MDQIDFEIELTTRDIINFDYIVLLLTAIKNSSSEEVREKKTEEFLRLFNRDIQLRKKKDLIKKFIEENLPKINKAADVEKAFDEFWESERSKGLRNIAKDENIPMEKLEQLIADYRYTNKLPNGQEVVNLLPEVPKIKDRQGIIDRIKAAIQSTIDIFEW